MAHESMAGLLGARRASVSESAQKLQAASLIRYRRGGVRILNKPRLVNKSCECYRFIRKQYKRLRDELAQLLYRK